MQQAWPTFLRHERPLGLLFTYLVAVSTAESGQDGSSIEFREYLSVVHTTTLTKQVKSNIRHIDCTLPKEFMEPTSAQLRIGAEGLTSLLFRTPLSSNTVPRLGELSDKVSVPLGNIIPHP